MCDSPLGSALAAGGGEVEPLAGLGAAETAAVTGGAQESVGRAGRDSAVEPLVAARSAVRR